VVPIFVPALRDRQEDIPLLADHFMAMLAREYGRRPKTFETDAIVALRQYSWPGNVRELHNVVERLMIMVPGDRISSRDLSFLDQTLMTDTQASAPPASTAPLHEARDRFERDYILKALAAQQGNISRTADVLGIERSNLYRKMRSFGIASSRRSEDEEIAQD
jgi:two-component system nitrogen regulation response regulator NtrX